MSIFFTPFCVRGIRFAVDKIHLFEIAATLTTPIPSIASIGVTVSKSKMEKMLTQSERTK